VVVDEREDGGAFSAAEDAPPTDGSAPPDEPPPVGEEDWQPNEEPQCVSDCAAWMDTCAFDSVCIEPSATCPGAAAKQVENVIACVCAGCADRCNGSCVMFDTSDPECLACQQQMVQQTCNYEYYQCVGF
jgi:hypothetical protein